MAKFTEYNLLRAVINSKGEMDDVYFARSFISLQNRVLRQVGIDRMTDALRDEQALLPRASKFLKQIKGEARLMDERPRLLPLSK